MYKVGEDRSRRFRAPALQSRVAIRSIAHEREIIGNGCGRDAELLDYAGFMLGERRSPIQFYFTGNPPALVKVFIRRSNDSTLASAILSIRGCSSGQRIVSLKLHHPPH